MSKLLPCPLCGGQPLILPRAVICLDWWQCVIVHDADDGDDGHLVRVIATGDTEQEAIEAAVAAWNKRNERTCRVVLIDHQREPWSAWMCDACGCACDRDVKYCPNCGAMVLAKVEVAEV